MGGDLAALPPNSRGSLTRAGIDSQHHRQSGVILGSLRHMLRDVEACKPSPLRYLQDFGVNLLLAKPGPLESGNHLLEERGARLARFSCVEPRTIVVVGSAIRALISAVGLGVVVTQIRGRSPRRSPKRSISQAAG